MPSRWMELGLHSHQTGQSIRQTCHTLFERADAMLTCCTGPWPQHPACSQHVLPPLRLVQHSVGISHALGPLRSEPQGPSAASGAAGGIHEMQMAQQGEAKQALSVAAPREGRGTRLPRSSAAADVSAPSPHPLGMGPSPVGRQQAGTKKFQLSSPRLLFCAPSPLRPSSCGYLRTQILFKKVFANLTGTGRALRTLKA